MKLLLLLLVQLTPIAVFSQNTFKKIQIEVLDKVDKNFRRFSGESESVQISLLRKTETVNDQTSSELGVSIEIQSRYSTGVMSSSGLTITSNLDIAPISASSNILSTCTGSIFLKEQQLEAIKTFLNETIAHSTTKPRHDTGWALEIDGRFTIALIYEKSGSVNWKYFMQLDSAEFEIPFEKGLDLMKELVRFYAQLQETGT